MKRLWVGVLGALTVLGLVGSLGPVDAKVLGPNGKPIGNGGYGY